MLQSKYFFSVLFCCFLLPFLLFFALPAHAEEKDQITSETLFEAFLSRLRPESMEMILDGAPDGNGRVRRIYLDIKGCQVSHVRIERLQVDAMEVTFTPPSSWDEKGPGVELALLVRTRAQVYEDDVDDALRSGSFGGDEANWEDIRIRFRDGHVYVEGHKKFLFLNVFFELQGQFEIRNGREIWLSDYSMRINNSNAPKGLTERTVSQIQPLIDFGAFPFPLNFRRAIQEKNYMILESQSSPETFKGKSFRYKRNN
jgi:hypothetical protein